MNQRQVLAKKRKEFVRLQKDVWNGMSEGTEVFDLVIKRDGVSKEIDRLRAEIKG